MAVRLCTWQVWLFILLLSHTELITLVSGLVCTTDSSAKGLLERVDCYPEGRGRFVAKEACEAKGCCYDDADHGNDKASADSMETRRGIPMCYFPSGYGYYSKSAPVKEGNTWLGMLYQNMSTPSLYGGSHVSPLALVVEEHSNKRVRIKLFDPEKSRPEVPFIKIPNPGTPPSRPLYRVEFDLDPFSVKVIRQKTNRVIFDTSLAGGLVFSEHFLQLSTRLASSHVYGLGEHLHTDGLKHNMATWTTWAIHAAGKHPTGPESNNLYGSHPVYMNIEEEGHAHMVLLLNQHPMEAVLQPTPAVTFRTIGGILDFYLFLGEEDSLELRTSDFCDVIDGLESCTSETSAVSDSAPVQAIQQYLQATGLPMMPPYWALGYQLSRWNYSDTAGLREVIRRNREADIPFDVQWGDVDYMDNAQTFTVHPDRFADLADVVHDLHDYGQRYVAIHDPGIKVFDEPNFYPPYDDGTRRDVWVKHEDGSPLVGEVWPGECVFADYTKEETRDWWRDHALEFHRRIPHDGFWIDMNELTNFNHGSSRGCEDNEWNNPPYTPQVTGQVLWNRTLCMDAVQHLGRHLDVHSLYGHTMANATDYAGRAIFGDKRFLIVTRSSFVGTGQFSGKWLGDNKASYDDMKWSIVGMIEMNMFGFPYVGADICGFFLNTTEQLCQRWNQLGAFYPMSRTHNQNNTRSQDPASFSPSMIESTRSVLRVRYRLLPYLYTLFHMAHTRASPVVRALAFEFPRDPEALAIDKQFLWGSGLLVSPVLTEDTEEINAYFPQARWFNYFDGVELSYPGQWHVLQTPLDNINVHVRGGHVIPQQEPEVTTVLSRKNPLSLLVAFDENFEAEGLLFLDDGETRDTDITKDCRIMRITVTKHGLALSTRDVEGHYVPSVCLDSITLYGTPPIQKESVHVTSSSVTDSPNFLDVGQVHWHPETNVLQLEGLCLDLTENHVIHWTPV